ncbi:glycosyltransferase family 2 protein [Paenibacillus sp. LHD-38]|uniref:glycosyltransferase family 2 protein n=1 Tax=Paenibacillus sp. LHD-38 TaxID=3072143 RepID=UPI00280EF6BE|nr:glycosyltransferase family 2 protein [Paenibacillus sp. LHD-38]MDQ8735765.1 glycosyltransferase family 2 protein [Paenibacillus sp. LHD-38]
MSAESKPQFTVVIPLYNRQAYVAKAIKSVIRQTYKGWKILIINDASTDKSASIASAFTSEEEISLISLDTNVGISKVLNMALKHVTTPYFVQLDSDDWLEPSALEILAKTCVKHPEAALIYGNSKLWLENKGKLRLKKIIRHRQYSKMKFLITFDFMLTPRCYKTSALKAAGGWEVNDPYEGRIMEDRRMCMKLIDRFPHRFVNRNLYNALKHGRQLTNAANIKKRNVLRKRLVLLYLKKWGNKHQPVFGHTSSGYLIVKKLKKRKSR